MPAATLTVAFGYSGFIVLLAIAFLMAIAKDENNKLYKNAYWGVILIPVIGFLGVVFLSLAIVPAVLTVGAAVALLFFS